MQLLLISDIECDYSNTKQGCSRLNFVSLRLLKREFSFHWGIFVLCVHSDLTVGAARIGRHTGIIDHLSIVVPLDAFPGHPSSVRL